MSLDTFSKCLGSLFGLWHDRQDPDELKRRFRSGFLWTVSGSVNEGGEQNSGVEDDLPPESFEHAVLQMLNFGVSEIMMSVQTLEDTEIYVRRFPYGNTGITKTRHLRRNIEKYLEEVYILRERLKKYVKDIEERFGDVIDQDSRVLLKKAATLATKSLDPIAGYGKVRGKHVHDARFTSPEIDRLTSLETFLNLSELDEQFTGTIDLILDDEYKRLRKAWAERVKEETAAFNYMVDCYFELLQQALFKDDCSPRFPFYMEGI